MGRDVAGLRIDKKPNNVVNVKSNSLSHDMVHVRPKISGEILEAKHNIIEGHAAAESLLEERHENQDVLGVKSTNCEVGLSEGKTLKPEALKSSDKNLSSHVKPASGSTGAGNLRVNSSVSQPHGLTPEKQPSMVTHSVGAESVDSDVNCPSNTDEMNSFKTAKKSQPNSPSASRKPEQPDYKKHLDEEDNWSLASSAAASVRTVKSQITVPVAPSFKCAQRAANRKEFYMKLEEKHRALEAERWEYEARMKEEQESAIKQLRKNLVIRANPVPSFYREGPPLKVELKKLPVTRPKSPNLSRRKSCGDASKPSPDEKGVCARVNRHSIGVYEDGSRTTSMRRNKDQISGRTCKVKDSPKLEKNTKKIPSHKMTEKRSTNVADQS